jgi:hypothetical protein
LPILFGEYKLINKIICDVKDDGTKLPTMTNVFKEIVRCEELRILVPFEGVCFGIPF